MTEADLDNIIQLSCSGKPTLNFLWDFSNASMDGISSTFIKRISKSLRNLEHQKKNHKIAVIAQKDLEYGITRMLQLMTDESDLPFKIRVFRHVGEACQWLFTQE